MQITPKGTPSPAPSSTPDAKARAIAAFKATQQSQQAPVQDPSNVQPEEMSAITKTSDEEETVSASETTETVEQKDTIESSSQPEAPKEAAKEEPLSSQYAQLARREKAIRAKSMEVKAQEAAFKAREDALAARERDLQDSSRYVSKTKLMEDPLSVLAEHGVDYNDLTNRLLNQPSPENAALTSELRALKDEIKALKGEQEKTQKSFEENQTNAYKQAVNQIRSDVRSLVTKDPNFEMVKATNSVDDVVELIERTFKEGLGDEHPKGTVLDLEVAAQMVEDYMVEEALKIARLSKIAKKLQPAATAPAAQKTIETKQSQPQKTLTNSVGVNRPLSAKERAILAFKNQLK